jgi:hypothetical protein
MNTVYLLMAEFNSAAIPLDAVAQKYFGLEPAKAKLKARLQQLPVPAFRAADSQKAPWLIAANDLADYLDTQCARAKKDWARMNS